MGKTKDRTVYRRAYGIWVNKRNGAKKATTLHLRQTDAINSASEILRRQGGGLLTVKDAEGKIYSREIMPPATDSNPLNKIVGRTY